MNSFTVDCHISVIAYIYPGFVLAWTTVNPVYVTIGIRLVLAATKNNIASLKSNQYIT
jgi:hypothetical protein